METTEGGQNASRPAAIWKPSKAEVIEHNLTHITFRNWCTHCIRGRAVNESLSHTSGREGDIPMISVDCFCMTEENVDPECQEEKERDVTEPNKWWKSEESGAPVLVMKERKSKAVFADVVPQKGAN